MTLDLRWWLAELNRRDRTLRPATPIYQRYDAHAHSLTALQIRASFDLPALTLIERRLRVAQFVGSCGRLWRVFSKAELGVLIVETTNRRRQLLAILQGRPEREKGPRLDPARLPDDRLDWLIQRHPDLDLVDRLRVERRRRGELQKAA